jgi:hypothetical protein
MRSIRRERYGNGVSRPEEPDPELDDWFEEPTSERQPAVRRRPGLPPPPERRPPAVFLLAAIALLIVLVVVIVALTGDDDGAEPVATAPPTATEPAGTTETETATTTEPLPTVPTEAVMRPGEEGDQVRTLQQALERLGYEPGEPDGNYGPATVEAVRNFQRAAGLPVDGIAGPETLNAINAALEAQG